MNINTCKTLNNRKQMPILGLGVFQSGEETYQAVRWALEAGYRHIDTAALYGNEETVGKAIRESGIPRSEIFVVTKMWNNMQRENRQRQAFEESFERLGLDYIDLYMLHWPVPEKFNESWAIMEELYDGNKIKSIGVCNFLEHHLDKLLTTAKVVPAVNQFECHPYCTRESLREYCKEKGIIYEAWSPLGRGDLIHEPTIAVIGKKYGKSVPQTILRWNIQHGIVTIPKSVNHERILQNADIFDFALSKEDMAVIDALNKNQMHEDPDNFWF